MGKIADNMLIGLLCDQCGSFIDGTFPGYPRSCDDCKPKRKNKNKNGKKR